MKVSQAVTFWLNYHRANSSKNTIRAYEELLARFCNENGEKDLNDLSSDEVLEFLNGIQPEERIFPICYETARSIVRKAGEKVGVQLRPHDLRRHAATFASRSGVPLEIVSKVILRHANLSTTQRYLGKISDAEAIRWIENIHG